MRNMNVGAAVGPPRMLITPPIGVRHVAGSPQCHSTWTQTMKTTARPRARSKPRTRSRAAVAASPVTESAGGIRGIVGTGPGARTSATGGAQLPLVDPATLPLALVLREEALPEADGRGRHLDELVFGHEL